MSGGRASNAAPALLLLGRGKPFAGFEVVTAAVGCETGAGVLMGIEGGSIMELGRGFNGPVRGLAVTKVDDGGGGCMSTLVAGGFKAGALELMVDNRGTRAAALLARPPDARTPFGATKLFEVAGV